MKYAIFSDMHSNLEAYQSVLNAFRKEGELKYFCIGDIVGYGADPVACLELTKELDPIVVCGNHDWAAVELASIEYFNDHAKRAVLWTASALGKDDKDYLRSLQLTYADDDLAMVHGTLMRPEYFDYVFDFQTAYQMIKLMPAKIAFIGHSHVPGIFCLKDEKIEYAAGSKIKIGQDKRYLVNVGSIGQPRDGDWRPSYCIWDKDAGTIEIKRIEYNIDKAQKKIIEAGLPGFLATRLSEGR